MDREKRRTCQVEAWVLRDQLDIEEMALIGYTHLVALCLPELEQVRKDWPFST